MEGDNDDPEAPPPPRIIPVPCMTCRRLVWVERTRGTYVLCTACEAEADADARGD